MAHFAKIEDGIVTTVIVAEQDYISTISGTWVQTSFNTRGGKHYDPDTGEEDGGTPLRKNYAGFGFTYDSGRDAFIPPKPYSSWTLNEGTCQWVAPTSCPGNEGDYLWDESSQDWVGPHDG